MVRATQVYDVLAGVHEKKRDWRTDPTRNFFSAFSMTDRRARSVLGGNPPAWTKRMPKVADDIMELMVSVVVVEAVHGVMGGGESGVAGDIGHLILGLDMSELAVVCLGEAIPFRENSVDRIGVGPL